MKTLTNDERDIISKCLRNKQSLQIQYWRTIEIFNSDDQPLSGVSVPKGQRELQSEHQSLAKSVLAILEDSIFMYSSVQWKYLFLKQKYPVRFVSSITIIASVERYWLCDWAVL